MSSLVKRVVVAMHEPVKGILLLHHLPFGPNAPTIEEHITCFGRYSQFKVWSVNTEFGFPRGLRDIRFQVILLHYSLFGFWPYELNRAFLDYLAQSSGSYKIAFFQDEYRFCQGRFRFLDQYGIDCVYTLLEPEHVKDVYRKYTRVPSFHYTLTGYVSEDLMEAARKLDKPEEERSIDVGYRARPLDFYMGRGAREKTGIAEEFVRRARHLELNLDIKTDEADRIYGNKWYEFLSNCRAMIGVESGVSIFDLEDKVRTECEGIIGQNSHISFEEFSAKVLHTWEDNIPYRTISPRHFEAAAFRICQILFEGKYSGILQPMVHYIPLKKDFSNFNEVMQLLGNKDIRHELTDNAYRDLIASECYSYSRFIEAFDAELFKIGLRPEIDQAKASRITSLLHQGQAFRQLRFQFKTLLHRSFPGRTVIKALLRPALDRYKGHKHPPQS